MSVELLEELDPRGFLGEISRGSNISNIDDASPIVAERMRLAGKDHRAKIIVSDDFCVLLVDDNQINLQLLLM